MRIGNIGGYILQDSSFPKKNGIKETGHQGKYDELQISPNSALENDKIFCQKCHDRIKQEMKSQSAGNHAKVQQLKSSIAQGTYQIDYDRLASRILGEA